MFPVARTHRDALGSIVGLLVFLGGIALLVLTFKLAYDLYGVPPDKALQLHSVQVIDFQKTGASFVGILIHTMLLVVMGLVSSLIANRGIALYSHSILRTVSSESPQIEETPK